MPKQNKITSRKNQRQSNEVDHKSAAASITWKAIMSMIRKNRYRGFPREVLKKDSKLKIENMDLSSIRIVRSVSDGIIGSGIKYVMFPLHVLRFLLFGTTAPDKKKEPQQAMANDQTEKAEEKQSEKDKEKNRDAEITINCRGSTTKSRKSLFSTGNKQNSKGIVNEGSSEESDEMVTAAEESDSSVDYWSTANNTINMSVDYDDVEEPEDPMDISFEEQVCEKSHLMIKTESSLEAGNSRTDTDSSIDEGIAKIFQEQCTSSEDEVSSSNSNSQSPVKCKSKNFLWNRRNSRSSRSASWTNEASESNVRGRKEETVLDVVVDQKIKKSRQEKRELGQNIPQRSKSQVYKEIVTQTDSSFSDDDVEMIPIEMTLFEKQSCCEYAPQQLQYSISQSTAMEQEVYPVASDENSSDENSSDENSSDEDSSNECSVPEHERMSSSTDLCLVENQPGAPTTDVTIGLWDRNSSDSVDAIPLCSRAPPGFPEMPQNLPLTSYDCNNPKYFMKTIVENNCSDLYIVAPAPSPMRHLYYEYPEFMDFSVNINSPTFLSNIVTQNY